MTLISKRRLVASPALALVALVGFAGLASADTPGTWTAYPGQSAGEYVATVQQPINTDGSSNFKANGKAVIPVKFSLASAPGPFVFESIGSDSNTANDYSYVSYRPSATLTLGELTDLSADFSFTEGTTHGGSLRFQIRTDASHAIFVYYGAAPNFADTAADQSGDNMLDKTDVRFDTSQYAGGTFYDTWAHAKTLVGETTPVTSVSLVLDSGWGGNQVVDLTSATVNGNTFTPAAGSGAPSPVSDLPAATIKIDKTDGSPNGAVNEPVSIQPNDTDGAFRIVDGKYMYNLATSSLSGVGTYTVYATIGGSDVEVGTFDLK